MSKPKNPYTIDNPSLRYGHENAYAQGLADGEKRMARALRKWLSQSKYLVNGFEVRDWLIARQKRGKK